MPTWTLQDIEQSRDLVMATDPARCGLLTVRTAHGGQVDGLPKPGDTDYLADVAVEGGKIVCHFDIPEGAPRVYQEIERNGVKRMVRVDAQEVRV